MRTLILSTVEVAAAIVAINILFGYWRANTRKYSIPWVLAIHVPVPLAIVLRLAFLGWNWLLLPVFIAAFAIGQFSGGKIRKLMLKQGTPLTSILVLDVVKIWSLKARNRVPNQE